MARFLTDAQRQNIVDLYESGESPKHISETLGVTRNAIYRTLKRYGIEPSYKIIPADPEAIEAFENGESVYSIANRLGVSRNVVDRWISNAGLEHRGCSEAGIIRAAAMTPEQRAAQARAAHDASRGRTATVEERIARAITVERSALDGTKKPSAGEARMVAWLEDRGLSCTLQKAVSVYNLDIAIGEHFAVEVFGGGWHAMKNRRVSEAARLEQLLGLGWNVLYVWNTTAMPMTEWCADKAVSLYQLTSAFPSARGKYWVVRGDGQITSFNGDYADEQAFIIPSHARK